MTEEKKISDFGGAAPGLAIMGCLAVGVLALLGGVLGLLRGDLMGAGVCLIPAAIAFGVVAYVSFSD
ncbi:MAG: hypothetical protein AAF591_06725 [Verrucomicrobiota bacterium]